MILLSVIFVFYDIFVFTFECKIAVKLIWIASCKLAITRWVQNWVLYLEEWGSGYQTELGIKMGKMISMAGKNAHHLIPWGLRNHDLLKILAKKGWHMNNPSRNGKAIDAAFHFNHPNYDEIVKRVLNYIHSTKRIKENSTITQANDIMNIVTNKLSSELDKAILAAKNSSGSYEITMNKYFEGKVKAIYDDIIDLL